MAIANKFVNATSLTNFLGTATQGAAGILGALNGKNNSTPAPATAATTTSSSGIPSWIWLAGGGAILLVIVMVFIGGRK